MSGWVVYPGYALLVGACLRILHLYFTDHHPHRYLRLYEVVGLCYVIGLGCKLAGLGPDVLRFWLADFGFPVALAYLINPHRKQGFAATQVERLEQSIKAMTSRIKLLVVCIFLSYVYEVVSGMLVGWVQQNNPSVKPVVGRFDWWDILAYTVGGGLGVALLVLHAKWLQGWRGWAWERDAATAALHINPEPREAAEPASARRRASRRARKRRRKQA